MKVARNRSEAVTRHYDWEETHPIRRILNIPLASFLLAFLACAADKAISIKSEEIGNHVQIIGHFGVPIGSYITIEGIREERGKVGIHTLRVEKVNGKALEHPTGIWVESSKPLPSGKPIVLKGYETGKMVGMPPDVVKNTHKAPQAGWQFKITFIPLE